MTDRIEEQLASAGLGLVALADGTTYVVVGRRQANGGRLQSRPVQLHEVETWLRDSRGTSLWRF